MLLDIISRYQAAPRSAPVLDELKGALKSVISTILDRRGWALGGEEDAESEITAALLKIVGKFDVKSWEADIEQQLLGDINDALLTPFRHGYKQQTHEFLADVRQLPERAVDAAPLEDDPVERIERALASGIIDDLDLRILKLRAADKQFKEIAAELSLSLGQVKVRHGRALRALREGRRGAKWESEV